MMMRFTRKSSRLCWLMHPIKVIQKTILAGKYGSVWNKLSIEHGLLLLNGKMVILFKARKRILKALYIPHNGIDKTRVAARQLYYWPKMNQQFKQLIGSGKIPNGFNKANSVSH